MAHEISKFFADPGRKYKQEIQRLEAEKARTEEESNRKLEEITKAMKERDERIAKLERERLEQEEKKRTEALRRSARIRLGLVALLVTGVEAAIVYFVGQYGEGATFLQKVVNSWQLLAAGFAIGIVSFWFILGKERIRILGWPFTKLLKNG